MAVPLVAWGVGALILWMMKSDAPVTPKKPPNGGGGSGTNAALAAAAPFVARIQKSLLAMGFAGDGELQVNGREDISTQLAIAEYWKASGGFVPLSYQQLAERLEAELAGKPAPSLTYVPPAALLARVQKALAKLGFNNLDEYFVAKGEFPSDNSATGWTGLVARLEAEAGITTRVTSATANLR